MSDAEQWGEGSHADRLERIIARAKQADKLERQLARECEKRQRLALKVSTIEEAIAQGPSSGLESASHRPSWRNDDGTSNEAEYGDLTIYQVCNGDEEYWRIVKGLGETLVEEGYGEDKLRRTLNRIVASQLATRPGKPAAVESELIEPAKEVNAFDWRFVPNAKLTGDRRHDAYHEKLRRSVEAIQEYNAGLDNSDQFSIAGSILRQLSKVKPGLVKQWIAEHKTELDTYNSGYGSRQNTGKPEPREVIKWSEQAYGEYEW